MEPRVVPPCYYPERQLEPSAQLLATAGQALVGDLPYPQALEKAKELLWEPVREMRALVLAHNPCPLDEIVMNAQLIGLNATVDYELMWIVDPMLTPELPVGWMRKTTVEGLEYYWNAIVGSAQWEHPQVSYLTGVAKHLRSLRDTHNKATAVAPPPAPAAAPAAPVGAPPAAQRKPSAPPPSGQRPSLGGRPGGRP